MLKKSLMFLAVIAVLGGFCAGPCFSRDITDISQLEGKIIAVPQGTIADQLVSNVLSNVAFLYYENAEACLQAVIDSKAHAAAYDEPVLRSLLRTYQNAVLLPDLITKDGYGLAVAQNRKDLKDVMDACIDELQKSGSLNAMVNYWFPATGEIGPMPEVELKGDKVLRFGTYAAVAPFTFKDASDNIVGLDIELATYIAKKLGMRLEIVPMAFDDMIPALQAGKVDMIGACITISQERAKQVLFSQPYYLGGIAAAVKK